MSHNANTANLINRFRNHKPQNKGSDITDGTHLFALIDYSFRPTDDHGDVLGIDLEVVQSSVMPVGMKARDAFWVSKSQQNGGDHEVERAMHFTNALVGNPNPNDVETFAAKSAELAVPHQPGRGLLIKCTAVTRKDVPYGKRSPKFGQKRDIQDRVYEHVADQSNVAAFRASLDQKYPITATVAPAPVAPAPQPAPSFGHPPGYSAGYAGPIGVYPAPVAAPAPAPYGYAPAPVAPPQAHQWPATPPAGWPAGVPYPPR